MRLFEPVASLSLSHRIVMAPLTRVRGTDRFACGPTAAQYYSERASRGGLLITEGSPISPETQYEYAAGIYTDEQTEAWKKVVQAVHAKGGKIAVQLWHLGRMCHARL
jgi:N-ethylmaleimide reductase